MDLFEYQARDLFEAARRPGAARHHGADPGRGPRRRSRARHTRGGGEGAGEDRWTRQGRRREAGPIATGGRRAGQRTSSGWTSTVTRVETVMVAEGADIAEEYYFSLLLDRSTRNYLAMCSREGGMDIETLAAERPDALARVEVDPLVGLDQAKADEIVTAAGFPEEDRAEIAPRAGAARRGLSRQRRHPGRGEPAGEDRLRGEIVALDGKVTLDAQRRLPAPRVGRPTPTSRCDDPLEVRARAKHLNYVKLDGSVGHHRQRRRPGDEHPRRGRRGRHRPARHARGRPTSSTSAAARPPR